MTGFFKNFTKEFKVFILTILIGWTITVWVFSMSNSYIKQEPISNTRSDYEIILNKDNSLYLISKDTIRRIDFYDLEEVILQDNL